MPGTFWPLVLRLPPSETKRAGRPALPSKPVPEGLKSVLAGKPLPAITAGPNLKGDEEEVRVKGEKQKVDENARIKIREYRETEKTEKDCKELLWKELTARAADGANGGSRADAGANIEGSVFGIGVIQACIRW